MKAAVVIITYNNEEHIAATISSVAAQTLKDWTAIIIDNGSPDTTFESAQKIIAEDGRFKAFKKSNEGPAAGRNLGFSKLPEDIEFIHFLDGDDVLHPDFLEKMTAYLEQNLEVGAVACQFDEIDVDGKFIGKGHRSRYAPGFLGLPRDIPLKQHFTPFVSFFASTAVGPYVVYRRKVFIKTNGFELKSQEDTDMYCKMSLLAPVHYIPEYLYLKRRHTNNLAHSKAYQATHNVFREKWDLYISDDPKTNEKVEDALKYYYTRHTPLRDFKVSLKSMRKFFLKRDKHALSWSIECFRHGIKDLLFGSSYKNALSRRAKLKKQVIH